jgi:hypothetical protein
MLTTVVEVQPSLKEFAHDILIQHEHDVYS